MPREMNGGAKPREPVLRQLSVVSVIAGGHSFKAVQPHSDIYGIRICINDAGLKFNGRVDHIVTMDRLWTEHRWPKLVETVEYQSRAFDNQVLFHARPNALQNIKGWQACPWVMKYDNDEKSAHMSPDAGTLNGTNSAMCGLNLAMQAALALPFPQVVMLYGFDMQKGPAGQPYWYEPYPWTKPHGATPQPRYDGWARQFRTAAHYFRMRSIQVWNISDRSKLDAFERVSWPNLRLRMRRHLIELEARG